jgi:uncharacterized protein YcaQ
MQSLTWEEVCQRRLARQYLLEPAPQTQLVEVVSGVCGLQAQIINAAEISLGTRLASITQSQIREAIWEKRSLVKTYGPRTTLHLLPANELPLWMAALRAYENLKEISWYEAAKLTPAQGEALLEAFKEALDGTCLTRQELADAVASRVGAGLREKLASTWGELLWPAAFAGLLCFGPSKGSNVTFVRADQWIGETNWQALDPHAALTEILRRYLKTYGPATYQDFGRWFALKPDKAHQILENIGKELTEVKVEGRSAWLLTSEAEKDEKSLPEKSQEIVKLLPQYDAYVWGATPRDRVVPEEARKRIFNYGRGKFEGAVGLPVLVVNGSVAGIWARRGAGKRINIQVEPFIKLTSSQQKLLEGEAARIGAFMGAEVNFSLGVLTGNDVKAAKN